jgi:hypothetical protein
MAEAKQKAVRYTSPKGTFVYPYLVKPDFGQGQFANTTGIYKVNLRLSEADAQPILQALQPVYDQTIQDGEAKFAQLKVDVRKKLKALTETPLYEVEYDQTTEEPTGFIVFKFATKASGINAKGDTWNRTIPLFDATGKAFKPTMVSGGTVGKVSFEAAPYFIPATAVAGVKLYLIAAQIIELSEGNSGGSASGYGFGKEEGYEADTGGFTDESTATQEEDDDQF